MELRKLVRIKVSEHRVVNIRRSSLCDNCSKRSCAYNDGSRVTSCPDFKPLFTIFLKCRKCGAIYDPYRCIVALDYEMCPECNRVEESSQQVHLVCCP